MRGQLYVIGEPGADAPMRQGAGIGVALAEDHPVLRRTLRRLIEGEPDMKVIAEATGLEEAVRQVLDKRPEVLVLAAGMAHGAYFEQVRRLRLMAPGTQIVLITMQENRALADAARSAGTIGFVLKDAADEELCEAIRRAAGNAHYRSPRVGES